MDTSPRFSTQWTYNKDKGVKKKFTLQWAQNTCDKGIIHYYFHPVPHLYHIRRFFRVFESLRCVVFRMYQCKY
jgi:hypothetical protein